MKLNVGDKFEVTDRIRTLLIGIVNDGDTFEVLRNGFTPYGDDVPCVYFKVKDRSLEYYARLDCIRKLTKLEKALK